MDDSIEDVFSDTISVGSRRSGGLNQSRFTIYHSAQDLADENSMPNEGTNLFSEPPPQETSRDSYDGPKLCSTMFQDGVRTVDFVIAWWQPSERQRASLPNGSSVAMSHSAKRQLFEQRLQDEGLVLEYESAGQLTFIKIHAPNSVLARYCEILKLRMPMREVSRTGDEVLGDEFNLMTEVKSLCSKLLSCVQLDKTVFPLEKFKLTAEYCRDKSYLFDEGAADFFSQPIRTLVVDFILERTSFSDDASVSAVGIQRLIGDGVYRAAYPLHDGDYKVAGSLRHLLYTQWAQVSKWAMYQPVDMVKEYFGVKYALYFAWLGFYTHMLIPASIVGLLCFLYGCLTIYSDTLSADICDTSLNITMCPLCDRTCDYWKLSDTCTYARITYLFDNPVTVLFAVFMSFWATLFLELWKRYSASIAHRWGLTNFCLQSEPPRPQYLARLAGAKQMRTNLITGVKEPYVPFWTVRVPATLISFSVVLLLIILAVVAVFGVVLYRMSVLTALSVMGDSDWTTSYSVIILPATAACINLACILVLNFVYGRLAVHLTEMELQRTQTEFDESLTLKIYLFQFVNYYTSIMYIAFLKGKFVGYPSKYNRIFTLRQEECNPGGCLMELCIQLAIIMIGQQTVNSILEMVVPLCYKWWNTLMVKTGIEKKSSEDDMIGVSNQWTEDYKLLDWGTDGLFYEYLEMVMQYGFVTIFVSAFPLAPFFALLNNVFEMRLDARKFLAFYRRPVPRRAPNIGVWFRILDVLGKLAVISNAFIIAFSSNFIPRLIYMMSVSPDHTDAGFLNYSLAYFNTSDFEAGTQPKHPTYNVSICRFSQYREPLWAARKYKRTNMYWHILAARLLFIVLFQNLVSLVMIAVQWLIPDMPPRLRDEIKREAFLTSELIIRHETLRAKSGLAYGDSNINPKLLSYDWRRESVDDGGTTLRRRPMETIELNDLATHV